MMIIMISYLCSDVMSTCTALPSTGATSMIPAPSSTPGGPCGDIFSESFYIIYHSSEIFRQKIFH